MTARTFAEVRKDSPTVGAVHTATALGNDRRKARLFRAFIGGGAKQADAPAVATKRDTRGLRPMADGQTAHSPFPYDAAALANLREDQVPRFFGALTDQDLLPVKVVPLGGLTAMQNRVDPDKVEAMRGGKVGKPALVVRSQGRDYIADGHHRLSADYLDGKDEAQVRYLDLTEHSNALKRAPDADWSVPFRVAKADPDQRLIFGWASVVEKDGRLVVDKQGDVILPGQLETAVYEYVLSSRDGGDMHMRKGVSRLVESVVFTREKQAAMGIELPGGMVGWWTGFYVDDDQLWQAHKRGERPEFSIGGIGQRVPV